MTKKKYTAPQTELLSLKTEGVLNIATNITYRDPVTGETHKQEIDPKGNNETTGFGDDEFSAGAKLHNYNAWDDGLDYNNGNGNLW